MNEGTVLFGRYQVERELGRGGMGRVLLAFDTKLGVRVAVKIVPDVVVLDTEAVNDLRQEVLRGMGLTHPGIVRTNHFELDDSGAAIVMEFVDGKTLAEIREEQSQRCFDAAQLLPWIHALAKVLNYAHEEARLVHRDLKPRNIMISRDGRLKVADFGISALLTDSVTRNTGKGPSSGTPPYMSPQQARGKRPNRLDDIYSLGATVYDLLTGKPPFFRGDILLQVIEETPPSMAERREEFAIFRKCPIPAVWEETIAACLSKEPSVRPQSAGEVLSRLQGLEISPRTEVAPFEKVPTNVGATQPDPFVGPTADCSQPLVAQVEGTKFEALAAERPSSTGRLWPWLNGFLALISAIIYALSPGRQIAAGFATGALPHIPEWKVPAELLTAPASVGTPPTLESLRFPKTAIYPAESPPRKGTSNESTRRQR
jgi:serine/threonine protein kinase